MQEIHSNNNNWDWSTISFNKAVKDICTSQLEEQKREEEVVHIFMGGNQNPNTPKIMDTIDYVEMRTSGNISKIWIFNNHLSTGRCRKLHHQLVELMLEDNICTGR